jgi:cytochrome c oxidase subunit 4
MDHPQQRVYYVVFAALLALLVLTVAVAEWSLGLFAFLAAISVATVKAALILLYFMHVRYSPPLIRLFAGAAFFWLAILFGLTLSDYSTREPPGTRDVTAHALESWQAEGAARHVPARMTPATTRP